MDEIGYEIDICDEIRAAEANWIIEHSRKPKQVILPTSKYKALSAFARSRNIDFAVTRLRFGGLLGTFNGLVIHTYGGEEIVFS